MIKYKFDKEAEALVPPYGTPERNMAIELMKGARGLLESMGHEMLLDVARACGVNTVEAFLLSQDIAVAATVHFERFREIALRADGDPVVAFRQQLAIARPDLTMDSPEVVEILRANQEISRRQLEQGSNRVAFEISQKVAAAAVSHGVAPAEDAGEISGFIEDLASASVAGQMWVPTADTGA
jgi:hypothetical protein